MAQDSDSNHCVAIVRPSTAGEKQQLTLMQEYLNHSLEPGVYISFPSLDYDESDATSFVQVLAKNQKCITATTCTPLHDASDSSSLTVSVQPLERMLPFGLNSQVSLQQAEVFIFEDECPLPIQLPFSPSDRRNFLQWDNHGQSELYESCISLRNPRVLKPNIDLLHRSCPTLCLLDALAERGWLGRPKKATHAATSELVYDDRQPMAKRSYYQCLVVHDEFFQAGIIEFRSGHPQTYYAYMLKYRRLPPDDKTMKQLQDYMNKTAQSEPLLPALPVPDLAQPAAIAEADSSDEIAWDEPPAALPQADDHYDPDLGSSPSYAPSDGDVPPSVSDEAKSDAVDIITSQASPDSDDSIAAEVDIVPSVVVACSDQWPSEVGGISLRRISGRTGGTNNFNTRLGVDCPCCIMKSRSTILLIGELGEMAPVIYLGAWLQAMGSPNHRDHKPSMADMLAFKSLHFPD